MSSPPPSQILLQSELPYSVSVFMILVIKQFMKYRPLLLPTIITDSGWCYHPVLHHWCSEFRTVCVNIKTRCAWLQGKASGWPGTPRQEGTPGGQLNIIKPTVCFYVWAPIWFHSSHLKGPYKSSLYKRP